MSKVIIHSCNRRKWYVDNYLTPSIKEQGIEDVEVWNDDKEIGNLWSCMNCFKSLDGLYNTWHLQDDVIISRKFAKTIKDMESKSGIVCGFKSHYSKDLSPGKTTVWGMWYSFTCIRIPNQIARECAEWVQSDEVLYSSNERYRSWINQGKYDDDFFREFLEKFYRRITVYNLNPNIVDHVDFLVGGPIVNYRSEPARAMYWEDEDLIIDLARKLNENK